MNYNIGDIVWFKNNNVICAIGIFVDKMAIKWFFILEGIQFTTQYREMDSITNLLNREIWYYQSVKK